MFRFDSHTIFLSFVITDLVSTLVVVQLWLQNRKRIKGASLWFLCYLMQFTAILLIAWRNEISDWLSIVIANGLVAGSIVAALKGLHQFLGKKQSFWYNYLILFILLSVQTWFTFYHSNLPVRTFFISLVLFVLFCQFDYLLYKKTTPEQRKLTRWVALIFLIFTVVCLIRIINYFFVDPLEKDFFNSGPVEAFALLSFEALMILLTYNISIMFNKSLLQEIEAEEDKFFKVFHNSQYGIVLTNVQSHRIMDVNRTFLKTTGYAYDEVVGKSTIELNLWKNEQDRELIRNEVFKNGKVIDAEIQFRKKNGETGIVLFSTEIVSVRNERMSLSSFIDITQRKQMEQTLRDNEALLTEMNASKDRLFSIFAHDLRSPFNSILGFSALLKENLRDYEIEKIEQFVGLIYSSASHTLVLLEDLLAWAKTQTGQMDFKPDIISLNPMLEEIVRLTSPTAKIKNIELVCELPNDVQIYADSHMVMAVLRNLLSNAIKFTHPEGRVKIFSIIQPEEVLITVSDNGVGISEEVKNRLFNLDTNYTSVGTANEKGTGLGLLICKEFVEKHGGKIWVNSVLGKGSEFVFNLPRKAQDKLSQ